ncbi:MAG TPA: sugar ABC transporter substrate-binding protein [Actinobacteria bacterium]|nr:sugar ABC transporter substrate-binding protein [Actinomycetota bacterium]
MKIKLMVTAILVIAVIGSIVLFGCTSSSSSAEATVAVKEDVEETEGTEAAQEAKSSAGGSGQLTGSELAGKKIAICTLWQANEWNVLSAKGAKETLEAAGAEVTVTDAGGDQQKQSEDLLSLVAAKPDLIILTLGDNQVFRKAIDAAADAGIPMIDVEANITGTNVLTHLWADQLVNGIKNANNIISYLAAKYDGEVKGNVVELYTPGVSSIDIRRDAGKMKLDLYPGIKLASVPYDQTNGAEDSRIKTEAYLQSNPDVDVLTGYYGEPVVGPALAVDALGLNDKVAIIGIDAFEPVLNLMRQGLPVLSAVQQDGYAIGVVAAKCAIKYFAGEELAYQHVMPLVDIYNNFPGKADNFPETGGVTISCTQEFKDAGLGWDY